MNKEYYIELIIKLEQQLKNTTSNKDEIKKKIRKIRKEHNISVYDKLKYLRR